MAEWKWSKARERAAILVADDRLTDQQIATDIGINKCTLEVWKANPDFAARVDDLVEAYRKRVRSRGIAIVENRVAALDDRWKLLKQVIAERAADETIHHVPGGKTGLLVRQTKFVKVYEAVPREEKPKRPSAEWTDEDPDAFDPDRLEGEPEYDIFATKRTEIVEEFAVDTGLLSELRAHELQAAKELGQLTEKRDITSGGKSLGDLLSGLSDEDLETRIAEAEGGKADSPVSP